MRRLHRNRCRPSVEGLEGRRLLAVAFSEVTIPSRALDITTGPDGNIWYLGLQQVGRITADGQVTEFPIPHELNGPPPSPIAAGPDGNIWYADQSVIRSVTPTGVVGLIAELPSVKYTVDNINYDSKPSPTEMVSGHDGNLWFTAVAAQLVGRVTPAGDVTYFTLQTGGRETQRVSPIGIAAGPDGNIWFAEFAGGRIGKIDPQGVITSFDLPDGSFSLPREIVAGPDGNLWFTGGVGINRMTTDGALTEYFLPKYGSIGFPGATPIAPAGPSLASPDAIVAGPDGNLWVYGEDSLVGRIAPNGVFTTFRVDVAETLTGITTGADGKLWLAQGETKEIARLQPSYGDMGIALATQVPIASNSRLEYPVSVTVTNHGASGADGIEVLLTIPDGLAIESASAGRLDRVTITGARNHTNFARISGFGGLAGGASLTFTLVARADVGPNLIQAHVLAQDTDTNPADDQASLTLDGQLPPVTTPPVITPPVTTPPVVTPPVATPPVVIPPVIIPVPIPPGVASLRTIRSKKKGLTAIVVHFDQTMDSSAIESLGLYQLATYGAAKKFRPRRVPLKSATYDTSTQDVTLTLRKPWKTGALKLNVLAAGARSVSGLTPAANYSVVVPK